MENETKEERIQRLVKEGIEKAKQEEEIQRKEGITKTEKDKPTNSVRNFIIFLCMIIVFAIIIAIFVSPDFKDATPQSKESGIVYDKDDNVISWGSQSITTDSYGNIIYTRDTCLIYLADSTKSMAIHAEYNDCTQEDIKQWSNAQGYKPITSTTPKVDNKPIFIEANRLNDLCENELDTSKTMSIQIWGTNPESTKVSDTNLINQMAEQYKYQDSVCLNVVNYMLKYRTILDSGNPKAWATNGINLYIDNNKRHEIWYQQMNNVVNTHITWTSWTVTKVTYVEEGTYVPKDVGKTSDENIFDSMNKCRSAYDDAISDAKRERRPTYKIQYAIDVCEDSVQYYEALPLGSYNVDGYAVDFNTQRKRDLTVGTESMEIRYLYDISIVNCDIASSAGYFLYCEESGIPEPTYSIVG